MSDNRTLIIAEAGVNHNGSPERARELVDVAAAAGADYVKFQTFKAEKLVSKKAAKAAYQVANTDAPQEGQYEMIKRLELDQDAHRSLRAYCRERQIGFLSTAFDLDSIDLLAELGLDRWKIPSGEITNLPYLKKIAALGKPTILSTGMADLREVGATIEVLLANGLRREQLTVLHCNTEYPTPIEDVNLRAMDTIAREFGVAVGYSDHTLGIEVPIAAVARGAVCIEKHFTLSRELPGPDHRASLEPEELRRMVAAVRLVEQALGSDRKEPSPSEYKNRVIARKSLHLTQALPAGHTLGARDLIAKRPGDGISPMEWDKVLGRKLRTDLPEEAKIKPEDLL